MKIKIEHILRIGLGLGVGVVCLVGLVTLFQAGMSWRQGRSSTPKERFANESNLETVDESEDVHSLRAEIDALRRQVKGLQNQSTTATTASSDHATARPMPAPPVTEAQERARTQKLVEFLGAHLDSEPQDAAWSAAATEEIASVLSKNQAAVRSTLLNAMCQSTLCRIAATHETPDAEQSFLMQLIHLKSFLNSDAFTERQERSDGSIETNIYISRSGHRLPEPQGIF